MAPRRRTLTKTLVIVGVVLLILWVVMPRVLDLRAWTFPSESMEPTIMSGSRAFTWSLGEIDRGDIITFDRGELELGGTAVKRVIAFEGETVEFVDGQVLIDGQVLDEPYLDADTETLWMENSEVDDLVVPAGHVFVLGDNRDRSLDSRSYGPIPIANIVSNRIWVWKSG